VVAEESPPRKQRNALQPKAANETATNTEEVSRED